MEKGSKIWMPVLGKSCNIKVDCCKKDGLADPFEAGTEQERKDSSQDTKADTIRTCGTLSVWSGQVF